MSDQEIAGELSVSEATVRNHVSRILGKLYLATCTQAALYAVSEGSNPEYEASHEEG